MASILNRQRMIAMQQLQERNDAKKAEAEAKLKMIASRPPRPPAGPLQKIPESGIATMRRQDGMGRRKKHHVKKTRKNARRV